MISLAKPADKPPDIGRDYLSYSAVKLYQMCPLRYAFHYVEGLPEDTVSSALVLGGAIHHAVEHHFRELLCGNAAPSHDELLAKFWQGCDERDLDQVRFSKGEDRESMGQLAERMLAAFQQSDAAIPAGRILGVEEELRGAIVPGCPDILGRVDLIVETESALVISDWKSARSRWSREQAEDSSEQLLLYAELARDLAPGKKVLLEFVVMTKAVTPVVERHLLPYDAAQAERTKRIVGKVWQAISAGSFYPAPSAMNCPGCPYRRECKAWPN